MTPNPDEECPHGMGDPDWCSICKHGVATPVPVTIEATFTARYDGQCVECNLPIAVGQRVHKLSTAAYVHEGCE